MTGVDAIFNAALSLPPDNRAALVEKLLESLPEQDRTEIEIAWGLEAEDRLRAYKEGKLKTTPGPEVMRSLRFGKQP